MGVDSTYGLACLGKINMEYENDQDLMVRFYKFVAKEEMACEEAELGPDEYSERLQMQRSLHQQVRYMARSMERGSSIQSTVGKVVFLVIEVMFKELVKVVFLLIELMFKELVKV
ncbi:hypothetical protein QVD17_14656 [Tagetes erecta]|uniref:Uncharacterized protein n=1 Tax=Tagetes erecta TaxID=13708 RepID=A0AAD8NYW6_TARER|nr:hypothetical protein QVD17_14656 [Tagetes erecta]